MDTKEFIYTSPKWQTDFNRLESFSVELTEVLGLFQSINLSVDLEELRDFLYRGDDGGGPIKEKATAIVLQNTQYLEGFFEARSVHIKKIQAIHRDVFARVMKAISPKIFEPVFSDFSSLFTIKDGKVFVSKSAKKKIIEFHSILMTTEREYAQKLCENLRSAIEAVDEFAARYKGLRGFGDVERADNCLCGVNGQMEFFIEDRNFYYIIEL